MKNAYLETFGCSYNQSDSQQYRSLLTQNGYRMSSLEKAQLVLVNSCGVKDQTARHVLRRVGDLARQSKKQGFALLVTGCMASIEPEAFERLSPRISVVPPRLEALEKQLRLRSQNLEWCCDPLPERPATAILQIARGCVDACSFCATKIARGGIQSQPIDLLQKRFRSALRAGAKEFWLTAQDTGAYGKDLCSSLPELLSALLENSGDFRLRLGMANPQHVIAMLDDLLPLFEDDRVYQFLHVPVQSGSDRVLRLMRRAYTVRQYRALVRSLRARVPNITTATDFIVGFPSESRAEFGQTVSLAEETQPDVSHISRYSARPRTLASRFPGQWHGRDKKQRSTALSNVCRRISLKRNSALVGETFRALVCEKGPKGGVVARSGQYKAIALPNESERLLGKLVLSRVLEAREGYCLGELV